MIKLYKQMIRLTQTNNSVRKNGQEIIKRAMFYKMNKKLPMIDNVTTN